MEHFGFVEKLLERMSMREMEILDADGNTAFCMAVISGNVKIATILLGKNPGLVWIRGHKDMLPIQLAFTARQPQMVKLLFEATRRDISIHLSYPDIVNLFFSALTYNNFTVASMLLETYPEFAGKKNDQGLTAFEVLAQLTFEKDAPDYQCILGSLFELMVEEDDFPDSERMLQAMFDAAKSGNIVILEFILKHNPKLLTRKNREGKNLLHVAISCRQVSVYQLIMSKGAYKNALVQEVDNEGNNILHLAGKLEAKGRFGTINHVLILSEELWFKEVEKIVPPEFKTMQNKGKMTPKELFHDQHWELTDKAVSELNEMANNFLVVATLVVTLGISAALTIRTNNIQGQTPILKEKIWYIIFLLSVAFGVAAAALSIVFHTSAILRSTWKQGGDPVTSRLIRIISGDFMLSISMAVMITISCMTGVVLIYNFFPKWAFSVIAVFCVSPVALLFVAYVYVWPLKLVLLLALIERVTGGMFSRIGIKWTAFNYIG
ncbi:hypothetical protein PIB30_064046 [Stylosanthes scabra]|uniref:PGG domain-containing protein n=1 Tax=Stylosanthes scabra TaxID=79078 RepID=A0ABU6XJH0_9FABA|nr:hypothetical protein [Stylosanthes scabra]